MPTEKPMQLGMIGLGRMGANLVRRLMRDGHRCVVYDVSPTPSKGWRGRARRGVVARGLRGQAGKAASPVDHGAGGHRPTTLDQLVRLLEDGDIVIDGGNSYYRDDIDAGQAADDQGDPLHRLRHEWRRLGPRAGLLPHDRGRDGAGRNGSIRSSRRSPRANRARSPRRAAPERTARLPTATSTADPTAQGIS